MVSPATSIPSAQLAQNACTVDANMRNFNGRRVSNEGKSKAIDPKLFQRMNHHVSNLPFAPQCPGAPKLPSQSLSLS